VATWRRIIATSCRKTKISAFLAVEERESRTSHAKIRVAISQSRCTSICTQGPLPVRRGIAPGQEVCNHSGAVRVPEYCRCTPAEMVRLLEEAGVVEDEDPVGLAEPFGYVVLEVVAEVIGVPASAVEEPLKAVGRCPAYSASCQPFSRPTGPISPRM
jgi:hypothetical protein